MGLPPLALPWEPRDTRSVDNLPTTSAHRGLI